MNKLTMHTQTSQIDLSLLEPRRLVKELVKILDGSQAAPSECANAGIELADFCLGGENYDIAYINNKRDLYDAVRFGSGLNILENTFCCIVAQLDQDFCMRERAERYIEFTSDFAKAASSAIEMLSYTLSRQHNIELHLIDEIIRSVFRQCLRAYGLSENYLNAVEESFENISQQTTQQAA